MTKAKNLVWFNACKDLKVLDCECIHSCASQFARGGGGGGGNFSAVRQKIGQV